MEKIDKISFAEREDRIRIVAYKLWEDEGRPEGRAEIHWMTACLSVDADAAPKPVANFNLLDPNKHVKDQPSTRQISSKDAA